MRIKRWFAVAFISTYLGLLAYGLGCHTLGAGLARHPLMYFIVWDMFCGWASYASQTHIIAEGESRKFYALAPAPWGEIQPWGPLGRRHYDALYNHGGRFAANVLQHTRHEPIARIFVIEECWPKKFDLPDPIWKERYGDEPKDVQRYCRVRSEVTPEGTIVRSYLPWLAIQSMKAVSDNPRLQAEATKGRPLFVLDAVRPGRELSVMSPLDREGSRQTSHSVGAPLGN